MENIEFFHYQLSLAGEIAVSHKNNILTDRIFLQISGRKQISAQQVINGTTVYYHQNMATCRYCAFSMCKIGILALQSDLDLVTLDLVTTYDLVFCKLTFFNL